MAGLIRDTLGNEVKVHCHCDTPYIRISELPAAEREAFTAWMAHQTMPLVPEERMGDTVYPWDYTRWLSTLKGIPVLWD